MLLPRHDCLVLLVKAGVIGSDAPLVVTGSEGSVEGCGGVQRFIVVHGASW